MLKFTALRPFPLSRNGIETVMIQKGDVIDDIPADLVDGLEKEDYIREGEHDLSRMPAPENKDAGPAPETQAPVDPVMTDPATTEDSKIVIPENWQELEWPQLRSLAASVSETPINSKDAAHDAITAYLGDED
jgi:hypothetical protein